MILTGRPVGAAEALAMGLANRVVPNGEALAEAQKLAAELARFPQATLRGDRRSAYEQHGLELAVALANEFSIGARSLDAARDGAARFASGLGRSGRFDEI